MELHTAHQAASAFPSRRRRLLKNHENLMFWVQIIADIGAALLLLLLLTYLKTDTLPMQYRFLGVIVVISMFGIYTARGVYRQSASYWRTALRIAMAWGACLVLWLVLGFVTKTTDLFSREVLLIWAPSVLLVQLLNSITLAYLNRQYKARYAKPIPTLVIGQSNIAHHLIKSLNSNSWLRDRVVGIVQSYEDTLDSTHPTNEKSSLPLLGNIASLRSIIKEHNIKRIYIALPLSESEQIEGLHIDLLDQNVDVIWAPDIFAMNLLNHSVREVAGVPLISLNESPLTASRVPMILKNAMDKSCATLGLIALAPLFLVIAILIKRSSPGPVFYKQDRTGFDGQIFKVYKFRSMKLHDDAEVVQQATKEDPRITKIGKFIRRTSIDELPQLINVLNGTMSLVGPRPHAVSHNNYYSDKIDAYLARHRIKPGITGLAQISGFRGETETLDKMERRVEYDLAYINNWSLALDVKILIKTPVSLFSKDIY